MKPRKISHKSGSEDSEKAFKAEAFYISIYISKVLSVRNIFSNTVS